jgi:CRISPR-associated protein Cas5d
MEFTDKRYCLEVRGDFACFTRPAIFWKPAIRWQPRKIEVLNPIQWTSVRRNEVGKVMSGAQGLFIEDARQQRAGLFLRDIAYRLHADLVFIPPRDRVKITRPIPEGLVEGEERALLSENENPGKYQAIFERRARKGQCFNRPYLGCREFSVASVRLIEGADQATCISETRDLGFMLYDLDFKAEGGPTAAFFRARLENGCLTIPPWDSEEVRR